MKKVLVTGADGFIGKNLTLKLLEEGYIVFAVVFPGSEVFANINHNNLHIISTDLRLLKENNDLFYESIDTFYHFAWNGVKPELRNDLDLQMANIDMTLNCMKFAIEKGVKKIIFPGSTNEYLYYGKPLNKDAIPSPNNAYGAAKIALRYLCSDYAQRNNVEFVYTIIAGIYAADRRDNNVIFYTIDKLLKGEKPMLTSLKQLWDYVYIDDVLDALVAVGVDGKGGAVYAIGHGDNWELSNYIKIIHRKINPDLPLGIGEVEFTGDVLPCSCIDLTDIMRDTNFRPKVDFETGIEKVINKIKNEME